VSNIPDRPRLRYRRSGVGRLAPAFLWFVAALAAPGPGRAEEESPVTADKSKFTLFNPTPAALMREFTPDRPDFTESPITVDAGHVQIEMSFFDFTRNTTGGVRTDVTVVGSFNLKLGLLNNTDLEFVLDPYTIARTHAPGLGSAATHGLGDALVRLKINLWGNDGPQPGSGPTAFGLLPFVKIPTASRELGNGRVEGGLILPFSVNLPAGFDLSAMVEMDFLRNDANTRYGTEFVQSLSLGHKVVGNLAGYIEYVGISPSRTGHVYRAYFSTGLSYLVGKNVQFDAGTLLGLSGKADALNVFSGVSVRF
jgi:Putative MetA-pathway of phenol degradation